MQKVQTVKLKDINEKELLYLIIGEGENKVIINVGLKTWEKVHALLTPQNEKNKKEAPK